MEIFHFSEKKLRVVRPSRPQHNCTKDYGIPLSYWYQKPKNFEPSLVPGSYIHRTRIFTSQIYDFSKNPFSLPTALMPALIASLRFLRHAGYKGVSLKMSGYTLVVLFKSQPVEFCSLLTKHK